MTRPSGHWRPGPADRLPGKKQTVGTPRTAQQPAYYARGTRGWHAYWTLLHPPYTLMHLSFVIVGAALAPALAVDRLLWTLLAFFLAMGLAAHALDELKDRPLNTHIPKRTLLVLAILGLAGAATIGVWGAIHYALLPGLLLIAIGVALVVAYNLELFSGRLHNDLTFVLAWGSFPALVAYFAQTGRLDILAVLAALYAALISGVQRVLSTKARSLRRQTASITGTTTLADGTTRPLSLRGLLQPYENALRLLVATSLIIALLLVALQWG